MTAEDPRPVRGGPAWQLADRARRQLLARAVRSPGGAVDPARAGRGDLHTVLQRAIREDTAASLGRAGRRLQAAVDALRAHDVLTSSAGREALLRETTAALYACVVQREALGLLDHRMLEQTYRVPREVWLRMGAQ